MFRACLAMPLKKSMVKTSKISCLPALQRNTTYIFTILSRIVAIYKIKNQHMFILRN
jgi:hypothetical protein